MADYDDNLYYNPEKSGLYIVAELDENEAWQFSKTVVWKEINGDKLYWAYDSGCSCPTPFEDYNGIESLEVLTKTTRDNLESCVNEEYRSYFIEDKERFWREVEKEL